MSKLKENPGGSNLIQALVTVYDHGRAYTRKQWIKNPTKARKTELKTPTSKKQKVNDDNYRYKKQDSDEHNGSSKNLKNDKKHITNHVITLDTPCEFSYRKFIALSSNKQKASQYLIQCHINWKHHSKESINWMRACIQAKKHSRQG